MLEVQGEQIPWITLGELLKQKCKSDPGQLAVEFDSGERITREELDARSDRVAAGLLEKGIAPGARIATLLHNSPEQVVLMFAAAKIGAIFTPLNISLGELDFIQTLRDSSPEVLVIEPDLLSSQRETALADLELRVVVTGGRSANQYAAYGSLESDQTVENWPDVSPDDVAGMLFTGGTTGSPKGVLRSHFSYMCSAIRYRKMLQPVDGDRHFAVSHLFHCAGQETGLISPLFNDVPTFFSRWFSASSYFDRVRDFRGTLGEMLGAMMLAILRQDPHSDDPDNPLRALMCATAGVPEEKIAEFRKRYAVDHLLDCYAMTETGTLLFCNTVEEQKSGSVGKSHGWCDVMIADELDRPVPLGGTGNILLRPTVPHSMGSGYFGRPKATLDHYRNLWIHTGDLGHLDDEGWLYFVGRQAHWLRRRGENVSAVEVEQVLDSYPGVDESAVFGVPSDMSEEDIFAVVVADGRIEPTSLAKHCAERLAYFKVPDYVVVTRDELPRSAAKGEIERHKLKERNMSNVWDRQNPESRRIYSEGRIVDG